MFNNGGNKIKEVSVVICWLGIIVSILIGGVSIYGGMTLDTKYYDSSAVIASIIQGIMIIAVGSIISWIGSLIAYGFGEMVENTSTICGTLHYIERNSSTNSRLN